MNLKRYDMKTTVKNSILRIKILMITLRSFFEVRKLKKEIRSMEKRRDIMQNKLDELDEITRKQKNIKIYVPPANAKRFKLKRDSNGILHEIKI